MHSAKVKQGDLFFALPGTARDGRDFIDDAITRGAVAILTDDRPIKPNKHDPYRLCKPATRVRSCQSRRQILAQQPSLIGAVTGTNGKTSTVDFMRQIWARVNWSSISIGTIGMRGGMINKADPPFADIAQLTTPDSLNLHETIAAATKQGVTHLALEASSHGLQQHRLDGNTMWPALPILAVTILIII